jgi:hypothetical protein
MRSRRANAHRGPTSVTEVLLRPDIREQSYLVARKRSASKWGGVHIRSFAAPTPPRLPTRRASATISTGGGKIIKALRKR